VFLSGVYCFFNWFVLFIGPGTVVAGLLFQVTVLGTVYVSVTDPAGVHDFYKLEGHRALL
jgi:hypothetical protein